MDMGFDQKNGYLVVSPDRYGRFGHQTSSIFSGIALAHMTNRRLLLPRYMFFAERWNRYIDWNQSAYTDKSIKGDSVEIRYIESLKTDEHGNRSYNMNNIKELRSCLDRLGEVENDLAMLPFDQQPGLLRELIGKEAIKRDLRGVLGEEMRIKPMTFPYICIHIRRGDCTKERHPHWYIENEFYMRLIRDLSSMSKGRLEIVVCTQGDIRWLRESKDLEPIQDLLRIRSTEDLFLNDAEFEDFRYMVNSEVLIGAGSQFSFWAAALGRQKSTVDLTRSKPCTFMNAINPDSDYEEVLSVMQQNLSGLI